MKHKNKLKLLLMLMLMGVPSAAQSDDADKIKQEVRARNFADFLLYWAEWGAFVDVGRFDKRRAERDTYEEASMRIPELVRDSTYYADEIVKGAHIINKRYPLDKKPEMAYFMCEINDTYRDKNADKSSDMYILGKNMAEFEKVLKELKLARYTVEVKQK